jgi:hypothetical protein
MDSPYTGIFPAFTGDVCLMKLDWVAGILLMNYSRQCIDEMAKFMLPRFCPKSLPWRSSRINVHIIMKHMTRQISTPLYNPRDMR